MKFQALNIYSPLSASLKSGISEGCRMTYTLYKETKPYEKGFFPAAAGQLCWPSPHIDVAWEKQTGLSQQTRPKKTFNPIKKTGHLKPGFKII